MAGDYESTMYKAAEDARAGIELVAVVTSNRFVSFMEAGKQKFLIVYPSGGGP
jgi:hypothetical protein